MKNANSFQITTIQPQCFLAFAFFANFTLCYSMHVKKCVKVLSSVLHGTILGPILSILDIPD